MRNRLSISASAPVFASAMLSVVLCSCPASAPARGDQQALPALEWDRDGNNPIIVGANPIKDVCDPTVLFDGGTWRLWASASTGDGKAYVCYSESKDGIDWDAPIIQFSPSSAGWDDQKVEVPTVIKDEAESDAAKRYKMWYGGACEENPDLTKIGYAYSGDGMTWTRSPVNGGLVVDPGDANVCSDPAVLRVDGRFYMWFNAFSEKKADTLQINFAYSTDGAAWVMYADNPALVPDQAWEKGSHLPGDADDVVHPAVAWNGDKGLFAMLYGSFDDSGLETYAGIGYAESPNGLEWVKDPANPRFRANKSSPGEPHGISTEPAIVYADGVYHLFYSAVDERYSRVICHAVSR